MLDEAGDPGVMLQEPTQSDPVAQQPLRALDYEPPRPKARFDPSVWLGVAAGLFLSIGVGFAVFGLMLSASRRDEIAAATGFGFGSFMFGLCLALLYWLRRGREPS
jgi:hypothetical protein